MSFESDETPKPDTRACSDQAFRTVTSYIDDQPLESGLSLLNGYRNQFDALEAQMLADNTKETGASRRSNETLLGKAGKRTKRENKKRATRANAVKENPGLGDDLANGELGPEQLDAIAAGATKTDGAAAKDQTLIDNVKNANPDDANTIVCRWVDDYKSPSDHETHRSRLRRLRKVSDFVTKRDTRFPLRSRRRDPSLVARRFEHARFAPRLALRPARGPEPLLVPRSWRARRCAYTGSGGARTGLSDAKGLRGPNGPLEGTLKMASAVLRQRKTSLPTPGVDPRTLHVQHVDYRGRVRPQRPSPVARPQTSQRHRGTNIGIDRPRQALRTLRFRALPVPKPTT